MDNTPVAEVAVGAAGNGGGLEVWDEVALALQQAALVVGWLIGDSIDIKNFCANLGHVSDKLRDKF